MAILKNQLWHLLILGAMIALLYYTAKADPSFLKGSVWGISTFLWGLAALLVAVVHQVYVLIAWRSELYYKQLTKLFGTKAFTLFKIGFAILFISRPITIIGLSISNAGTLSLKPSLSYLLSTILTLLWIYLIYSVKRYFGIDRAFGIDHFFPEKYKNVEMVKKGIFQFTSNGMYVFGFLILYVPALLLHSKAALLMALFSHLYIWVHYYFTERPNMKEIYES